MTDAAEPEPDPTGATAVSWARAAAWALLLSRWVAAQVVAERIVGYRRIARWVGLVGLPVGAVSLFADPNWPWLTLAALLVVAGGGTALALSATRWLVRRLALPRRARPLATALEAAKANLLAELARVGAPVTTRSALAFVVDLARGRAPHRGAAEGVRALVAHLDTVLDVSQIRAALDDAA